MKALLIITTLLGLLTACKQESAPKVAEFSLRSCINGTVQPFTYDDGDENPGFEMFIQDLDWQKEGKLLKDKFVTYTGNDGMSICSADIVYTKKSVNVYTLHVKNVDQYKINPAACIQVEGAYEMTVIGEDLKNVKYVVID